MEFVEVLMMYIASMRRIQIYIEEKLDDLLKLKAGSSEAQPIESFADTRMYRGSFR